MSNSRLAAIAWVGSAVFVVGYPAPAHAQAESPQQLLKRARAAQVLAEQAQQRAEAAAKEAEAAAELASAAAEKVRVLLAATPPKPVERSNEQRLAQASPPPDDYATAYTACEGADRDIASVDYFRRASHCEQHVLREASKTGSKSRLSSARSRRVTGLGTALAVDSAGATATLTLGHSWRTRSTRVDDYGPQLKRVEQQRISDWTAQIGVRANVDKDEKARATIATFGSLDRLTSNVAFTAQFGRTLTTSEPWDRITFDDGVAHYAEMASTSVVSERAEKMKAELLGQCRKDTGSDCEGEKLFGWIFAVKAPYPGEPAEFAHPDAVKAYNAVYWGPPRDALPRFGWLIRGEISFPRFDYYPFALTQVPDPFAPGTTKTAIDPALFPTDFASRIVHDGRVNFSVGARGFFHVSRPRSRNYLRDTIGAFNSLADWNLGTTVVGSLAYVRNDQTDKDLQQIKVCPVAQPGQTFQTDQVCTTLDIGAPRRTEGLVAGIELRQGIDVPVIPPALIAPRLTYNTDSGEFGLAVPLYFASDDKGVFTGGLKFGRIWGGRDRNGVEKDADTRIGVVFGVKVGLDGNSSVE